MRTGRPVIVSDPMPPQSVLDHATDIGADLWHFRSLVFTNQPDFMIGNSYGKFIQRDTLHKGKEFEVPLIRLGFPIFDRHHLHKRTILGYAGAENLLTDIVNMILDEMDRKAMATDSPSFDLVR